jgi:aryl-alcohol dehydrogenase-like predicted oxidoreductase
MNLDYVDIFYSHRFDPETPLEETMGALDRVVRQGKALYAGISSYSAAKAREAAAILRKLGTPLLTHQPSYSMSQPLDRARASRRGRRARYRLHRLFAVGARDAHR